jgi:8-oxo-dGTP pyrophosphatase MutT (NUDIX family)
MSTDTPHSTFPTLYAQFSSEDFVVGGGVAIFHIASQRVVVCSAVDRHGAKYYFLPKGRRDAGEESRTGAEREGFEEVLKHIDFFL